MSTFAYRLGNISGIEAAWAEHDGLGELTIVGRTIRFDSPDGYRTEWPCRSAKEAATQLRLFRTAIDHPETRPRECH